MKRKNNTTLRATAATTLLELMQAKLGGMSVTSIKQLLRARRVQVNGAITTRGDQALNAGDEVTILAQAGTTTLHHPKLSLVYEDDYLLVVNKKQGLLTVSTRVTMYMWSIAWTARPADCSCSPRLRNCKSICAPTGANSSPNEPI